MVLRVFNRTIAANPQSREATVWSNLKGNSPCVQALQKEFMETFQKHGFGCVEGSKRTTHEATRATARLCDRYGRGEHDLQLNPPLIS